MREFNGFHLSPEGEIVEPTLHDAELKGIAFDNDNDKVILDIGEDSPPLIRIEPTGVEVLSLTTDHIQNVIYAAYIISADQLLEQSRLASYVSGALGLDLKNSRGSFFILEPASGVALVAQLKKRFSVTILQKSPG